MTQLPQKCANCGAIGDAAVTNINAAGVPLCCRVLRMDFNFERAKVDRIVRPYSSYIDNPRERRMPYAHTLLATEGTRCLSSSE